MLYLMILLIGIPIGEIYVFILVGGSIGGLKTLALVVLTAVLGGYLLRREGSSVLRDLRQKLRHKEFPAGELAEALLVLLSGALLLTPGFITDIVGFLLILPWSRRLLGGMIIDWLMSRVGFSVAEHFWSDESGGSGESEMNHVARGGVIDVDYEEDIVSGDEDRKDDG